MAEKSLFWFTDGFTGATGDGAAPYTQDEFSLYNQELLGEGVVYGAGDNLEVSGTATPLDLETGRAQVRGFSYWNSTASTLAVTTPTTGTTGGRVVLRADYSAATVRAVVKMSTDGNASIPALTQVADTTWEISLAAFTVTTGGVITVTDDREYIGQRIETAHNDGVYVTDSSAITDNINIDGHAFRDGDESKLFAFFTVPSNFVNTKPIVASLLMTSDLSGDLRIGFVGTKRAADGSGLTTFISEVATFAPSVTTMIQYRQYSIESVSARDVIALQFVRFGGDGADTNSGTMRVLGIRLDYWVVD